MSNLRKLIQELCPDGVEYFFIGDICSITRGRVISKDYIKDSKGDYPVYSSQTENNGELGRISTYDFDGEYVTWTTDGANAGSVFYRLGKFSITNVCGLLKPTTENFSTKFLYYALSTVAKAHVNAGMGNPKLMSNVMSRIKVPVPPFEVQREIVRILDNFTELTSELTKELSMRKQQYEYYCYELLTFHSSSGIKYTTIGDSCFLEKGKTPIQKAIPGRYPLVVTTEGRKSSNSYQFDKPAVCIPLISSRGHGVASLNKVYYQEGKFALGNILCAATPKNENKLTARFLAYYLNCKKDILLVPLMKGGANVSLNIDALSHVKVPVPPLNTQMAIVRALNSFMEYEDFLKREIDARQKQYEYYRDKLLTFKEKSA